jgi:hypothetical protein
MMGEMKRWKDEEMKNLSLKEFINHFQSFDRQSPRRDEDNKR